RAGEVRAHGRRLLRDRRLLVLAVLGFTFTLRLKYGEFIVLRTFCPWCAISAVSITVILVLSVIIFREARARLDAGG
ncbi:MAG TPA: vitamin K epoxide reductase family protein, partial [Gemmatimonadales bacterium]|nr:vitamin K epoxide reductase family protein [Gemmatimonadales bacterium]